MPVISSASGVVIDVISCSRHHLTSSSTKLSRSTLCNCFSYSAAVAAGLVIGPPPLVGGSVGGVIGYRLLALESLARIPVQ